MVCIAPRKGTPIPNGPKSSTNLGVQLQGYNPEPLKFWIWGWLFSADLRLPAGFESQVQSRVSRANHRAYSE